MRIYDSDCCALEEGHDAVGRVDVCIRVDDEIFEGWGCFSEFYASESEYRRDLRIPFIEPFPADTNGAVDADE